MPRRAFHGPGGHLEVRATRSPTPAQSQLEARAMGTRPFKTIEQQGRDANASAATPYHIAGDSAEPFP